MAHVLRVGAPYNPARRSWPEAATYTFRGGEHELLLFLPRPRNFEVRGVTAGEGALALLVDQPVIVLLFRFGIDAELGIPWGAAPFTMHLVPPGDRILPSPAEGQATLRVVLVDAEDGIVHALRVVLLPPGFTQALHGAITEQARAPWDARAYEEHVAGLLEQHTDEQLVQMAA